MSEISQAQRAGANSIQYQVFGDLHTGISEERVREIFYENSQEAIAKFSAESLAVANKRVEKFDENAIKKLAKEGLLESLSDPSIQITLRKAQLGAASSEREADYEMLANLLKDRAKFGDNRTERASINRAVEVVDQLDEDALTGLSVFSAIYSLRAQGDSLEVVLDLVDQVVHQILGDKNLPTGRAWIDHLEILDAIRVFPLAGVGSFDAYWSKSYSSWLTSGVPTGSAMDVEGRAALDELDAAQAVIPNVLNPGYTMYCSDIAEAFSTELPKAGWTAENQEKLREIGRVTYGSQNKDDSLVPAFMEMVQARPRLKILSEWWQTIPIAFDITAVGKVLARANVRNSDRLQIVPGIW